MKTKMIIMFAAVVAMVNADFSGIKVANVIFMP